MDPLTIARQALAKVAALQCDRAERAMESGDYDLALDHIAKAKTHNEAARLLGQKDAQ